MTLDPKALLEGTTAGPWEALTQNDAYETRSCTPIAQLNGLDIWPRPGVQTNTDDGPDARLMAAAPELAAEVVRLRTALASTFAACQRAPDLNMSNYDEEQVGELNAAMIEVYWLLQAALATPAPGEVA